MTERYRDEHGELDKSEGPLCYGECVECNELVQYRKFDEEEKSFVKV